jgi:hypothetical protein
MLDSVEETSFHSWRFSLPKAVVEESPPRGDGSRLILSYGPETKV